MYLAFSLAGGIVTYWTILREAGLIYEEVTGEKHGTRKMPIISFIQWIPRASFLAPLFLFAIITGQTTAMINSIASEWLKDAGYND